MNTLLVPSKSSDSPLSGCNVAVLGSWITRMHCAFPGQTKPNRSVPPATQSPSAFRNDSMSMRPSERHSGKLCARKFLKTARFRAAMSSDCAASLVRSFPPLRGSFHGPRARSRFRVFSHQYHPYSRVGVLPHVPSASDRPTMSAIRSPGRSISEYSPPFASLYSTRAIPSLCSRAQSTRGVAFGMFRRKHPVVPVEAESKVADLPIRAHYRHDRALREIAKMRCSTSPASLGNST